MDKKVKFGIKESHSVLWDKNDWRYAILMGGRGNGRSGTASRYAVSQLLSKEYTRGAIMRAVREDIRTSCWGEIIGRLQEQDITGNFKITDNEMLIEKGRNSIRAHGFRASSGSLTARLKSLAEYNFVWIEEAEEINQNEFRILDDTLRTKKGRIRIVLTLNTPPKNHWIIKKWFDLEPTETKGFYQPVLKDTKDAIYIGGTFRENESNLEPATISKYLRYKQESPDYYWQTIEGLSPEVIAGRIYSGWQEIDKVPHEARLIGYGLDFGFDPDPAAILAIYYFNGAYILDELLYQTELLNEHLALFLKSLPFAPIIADSAEQKAIEDIKRYQLNIIGAEKGPGSVKAGIKEVQSFKISFTSRSTNLKHEYENLAWKISKDGQNIGIEDPACPNHLLSAARYGLTTLVPKVERMNKRAILRELGQAKWNAERSPSMTNPV